MLKPVDLIIHAQCGHAGSPTVAAFTERAESRLRPGGPLVCGLDRGQEGVAVERLWRALPDGQVRAEPLSDGVVVVVQSPQSLMGVVAFDTRR